MIVLPVAMNKNFSTCLVLKQVWDSHCLQKDVFWLERMAHLSEEPKFFFYLFAFPEKKNDFCSLNLI